MGDSTGSRGSSVNAKKILRDIMDRLDGLDRGLKEIGSVLGDGERKRREEMVESLRNERANLQRMVEAGVRTQFSRGEAPLAPSTNGQMPGGLSGDSPWGGGAKVASGRVFGKKAEETDETRPLDDGGLLQLQQAKMDNQDGQLEQLSQILRRQRGMGEEIHREIGEQTEMLEDIDNEVGKVGSKMARAKRQMNKLN
jgi:regulator of vacuolar morphogenesis